MEPHDTIEDDKSDDELLDWDAAIEWPKPKIVRTVKAKVRYIRKRPPFTIDPND